MYAVFSICTETAENDGYILDNWICRDNGVTLEKRGPRQTANSPGRPLAANSGAMRKRFFPSVRRPVVSNEMNLLHTCLWKKDIYSSVEKRSKKKYNGQHNAAYLKRFCNTIVTRSTGTVHTSAKARLTKCRHLANQYEQQIYIH